MRIGLVTSSLFPRPEWRDADTPLVRQHLDAEVVAWDSEQDWARFDALVLQSPWSMWERLDRFARWLDDRAGTLMLNPPDVVRLGSDKRYLATIEDTVPTIFVEVVQPYVEAIDIHRELGVLTLNGEISHAITKGPILKAGTDERAFTPDPQPYELSQEQRRVVMDAYAALFAHTQEPLSVRLDFIIDPESPKGLLMLEVEMVAPVKFFGLFPDECRRYAEAIEARVKEG